MAISPIVAIVPTTAVRNGVDSEGRLPVAGETLELVFRAQRGDRLQATSPDGLSLELAGMAELCSRLVAGDVLHFKVLSTAPRLALALFQAPGQRAAAPPASLAPPFETEPSAMRQDQVAWLRQLAWPAPDPAALASSWRSAIVGELQRRAALREDAASLPAAERADAAAAETGGAVLQRLLPLPGTEPWQLVACTWRRLHLILGVQPADDADGGAPRPRERAQCLRMDVTLPGLGEVCVVLHLVDAGVMLDLVAEREDAMQALRDRLPALVRALARADLRVLRWRLLRSRPIGSAPAASSAHPEQIDRTLPPALFRAAAELLIALD
jgi:hypothetical protein